MVHEHPDPISMRFKAERQRHAEGYTGQRPVGMREGEFKNFALCETTISFETATQGPCRETFRNIIHVVGAGELRTVTAVKVTLPNFSFSVFAPAGPASVPRRKFEGSDGFFGTAAFDANGNCVGFHLNMEDVPITATLGDYIIKIPGTSFVGQMSNIVVTPVGRQSGHRSG